MDINSLFGEVGGVGSVLVLAANWWLSHKSTRIAENTEERNEEREPFVRESLAIRNVTDAFNIVTKALDISEESKEQVHNEFREFKIEARRQIAALRQEVERLRTVVTEGQPPPSE